MNRLKRLGKDAVVYGVGGILAKGLTFFLLPVYTRIFSPAEYGTIEMLTLLSSFLGVLLVMGTDAAQAMYFYKEKEKGQTEQAKLVSAILQWRLLWGGGIVLVGTLFAPFLNSLLFSVPLALEYFVIAFVGILFTQVMNQSAEVMRLLYKPWRYISITLTQSVLAAALILIFVLIFDGGIKGYFLGTAIASAVVSVLGWYVAREYVDFKQLHGRWWPQLIRFGAPLIPAGLAMYFMSTADRWFVQYYLGQDAVGLFAVGAKFGMIAILVIELFRRAAFPVAMDAINSDDGEKLFSEMSIVYFGLGAVGATLLTLISPLLVSIVAAPEYYESWKIVGIIGWQCVFYGYFVIAGPGLWRAEKTYLRAYIMGLSAVVGIILNLVFVPKYGIIGAAFSTALTYAFAMVLLVVISQRYWAMKLPFGIITSYIFAGLGVSYYFFEYALPKYRWFDFVIFAILALSILVSQWSKLKHSLRSQ